MPGPAPQPTAIKRGRGNPGKRPLNTKEPQPLVGLPSCPDYLPDEAKAIWDEVGSALVRNGVMSELDGMALADLIETEILNRELTRGLRNAPPIVSQDAADGDANTSASAKKNPLWALKLDYLRERRAQQQRFGLDPASRSKILALTSEDDDPLESAIN